MTRDTSEIATAEFIVLEKNAAEKAVNFEGAHAIFEAESLEEIQEVLALKTGAVGSVAVAPDGGMRDGR